jgi:flagellar motility protein MotE (MotC chaperone)
MGDPRNVAHAKKVTQEKHHKGDGAHAHQPGKKKTQQLPEKQPVAELNSAAKTAAAAKPGQKPDAAKLEKSLGVLAKLKELEFHSRANIEKLAELSLTIEDELKQKAFVEAIGDVYSAQEAFHSKIAALIEAYQAECDRLKPAAG